MICERCHLETDTIKPLGIRNFTKEGQNKNLGYLKICAACYPDIEALRDQEVAISKRVHRQYIARTLFVLLGLLLITSTLWMCYIKYGEQLSNGKNPDNYIVSVHRVGGTVSSYSASRFDVDPLPFWALTALIAVSCLFAWMIYLSCPGLFDAFRRVGSGNYWRYLESLRKELQVTQYATNMADHKVYVDTQFSKTDTSLTSQLFSPKKSVN